jgi:hypothetical protein
MSSLTVEFSSRCPKGDERDLQYASAMTLGGGLDGDGGDSRLRAEGASRVPREGKRQYDLPNYGLSLRSTLIALVIIVIIVGAIVIFIQ